MEQWMLDLRNSVTKGETVDETYNVSVGEINEVRKVYPMRIPRYYYNLIQEKGDPIWMQAVPSIQEVQDEEAPEDPLNEDGDSPVPRLTHRYPDRVLFLITDRCPMYCRFCTRKRMVGRASDITLEHIIARLRTIPHVQVIRIGTKFPCVLPSRITDNLCNMLKKYHPIYVNTHFNHPREITPEAKEACERLVNAGIPVGCQTVLMRGVNDDPEVMKELMHKLLMMRVRPYYLYQADLTRGTNHFRTRVEVGLQIIQALRGHTTGFAVPQFVIDAPGGGGKIPLMPEYVQRLDDKEVVLKNFEGKEYHYPQVDRQYVKDAREIELINF